MSARRGFTIVELVVTMVIMAILLTLGVVSLVRSQANARDTERRSDTDAIARGLEVLYRKGYTAGSLSIPTGSYPDVDEMNYMLGRAGATTPNVTDVVTGTTDQTFRPPSVSDFSGMVTAPCTTAGACPAAVDSSASGTSLDSVVTPNVYYYEPIDANGNVCKGVVCVRFNLYWRTEVPVNAATLGMIRSKHQ